MKYVLCLVLSASVAGCTGPSSQTRPVDRSALTERQANQIPQSRTPGIQVSGTAEIGVVRNF